jgi:hypothetical protein
MRFYAALEQIFDATNACASTALTASQVNKISIKLNETDREKELVFAWMI